MTPLALVVAACFLAALIFLVWRPQYAAVGVLVMFPLEQLAQVYFTVAQQRPILMNALVAIVAALAVALRFSKGERIAMGYSNPVTWLLWTLYALCWATLAWSPAPQNALSMLIPSVPYYVLMMLLLPLMLGDLRSVRPVFVGLLVVGTIIAALILASPSSSFYAGRLTLQMWAGAARERGNPLALGEMGGMMAIVGALLMGNTKNPIFLGVRVTAIIVGLGLAIASGSRGQVIGAVAAGFLFMPFARRVGNFKQFVGLGVVALVMYGVFSVAFRLFVGEENESRWQVSNFRGGVETRLEHASTLFNAWVDAPGAWLFGLGSNAFYHVSQGGKYVHNIFVEVLCEQGFFGFSLLMAAILLTARYGWRLLQLHRDDPAMRSTAAALCGLCFYSLLLAMKQGTILGNPNGVYLWVILVKVALTEEVAAREQAWLAALEAADAEEEEGDEGLPELVDEDSRPPALTPAAT